MSSRMKTFAVSISLLFLLCFTPLLHAQDEVDPQRAAAAEGLLKAMHIDQMMVTQKENLKKTMGSFLPKDLSPEALKQAQEAQAAALDAVFQQLSWDSLKPDFIKIYAEVYTEQELKDLTAFYNSPIGQKFIEKMPELQTKTMEIMQKRMITLLPAVQAAAKAALQKAHAADSQPDQPPLPPQPPQP
jgi:uncharacterized protein